MLEVYADSNRVNHHYSGESVSSRISVETKNEKNSTDLEILESAKLSGKSTREKSAAEVDDDLIEINDLDHALVLAEHSKKTQGQQWFQHIHVPDLVSPKSIFQGYLHALPIDQETIVLQDVLVMTYKHLLQIRPKLT